MIQQELKKIIKHETGIDLNDELVLKSQRREYVETRGMFCELLRECTNLTLISIGKSLQKDHTTVMYGLKNFKVWTKQDKNLEMSYIKIKSVFRKFLQLQDFTNLEDVMENYITIKKEYKKLYDWWKKSKLKDKPEVKDFVHFL